MATTQSNYILVLTWNFVKNIKDCYLPIVNTNQIDIKLLVNSICLIYLKTNLKTKPISNVTGYYGYFTINKVILKNDSAYKIHSDNTDNIITDSKLYSKLLASYNYQKNLVMTKLICPQNY